MINEAHKQIIYELMCATVPEADHPDEAMTVRSEFYEGSEFLLQWDTAHEAAQRLRERLGSPEDADVQALVDALLKLNRLTAMKMFDYGVYFAPEE